jgi:hypothetical protein
MTELEDISKAVCAAFRATTLMDREHVHQQLQLLWRENAERKKEQQKAFWLFVVSILSVTGFLAVLLIAILRQKIGL